MRFIFTLALAALFAMSCSKDDGVGAYSISGSPEITSLQAGYKRVVVTWNINTTMDDAALTNIYWDGGSSSTGQYITSDTGSSITVEITDLAEGEYTFYAQNATPTSGKYSAPSESITVYVYGEAYCKSLEQRSIASTDFVEGDEDGVGQRIDVTWGTAPSTSGCIGTSLNYYNRAGDLTSKFCALSESVTALDDALVGTDFDASTLYLLADCIDTLASSSTDTEALPMGTGTILVGSLKAMQPYLAMDSVHVILDKGDYFIKTTDIESGDLAGMAPTIDRIMDASGNKTGDAVLVPNGEYSFFHISGNHSTYDFGGSTVTVYTSVYQYVSANCTPLRFTGSYNTVKNLELIDDGVLESTQTGITNVIIDGEYNLLTQFKLQSRGSYPYGYGELFGKGGGNVISHQKHCGVLVRGDYNTFADSEVYHKGYGHCVFMQGATYPTISGCYIESLVSTTQAVYAEKGTGSPADKVDFLTYFGFHMSENYNYTMALCEEGIRAYDSGVTVINNTPYDRGSVQSPTIKDCTVKDTRGGVTLTHSSNAYVENCKVTGCGRGIAVPSNATVKNCSGDAQYGPLYGVDYQSNSGTSVDMTLIDQEGAEWLTVVEPRAGWLDNPDQEFETCNGTAHIAYIEGNNHKIKLRDGRVNDTWQNSVKIKPSDYGTYPVSGITFAHIGLGGDDRNLGSIWMSDLATEVLDENGDPTGEYSAANPSETISDDGSYLTNSYIANETDWPVWVDSETSGCKIWSNAVVIIESGATGNTIYVPSTEYIGGDNSSANTFVYGTWDIDTCFSL